MKTLYNRLAALKRNNKSGIICFTENSLAPGTFSYMAYFHSLGYVFCENGIESSYFHVDSPNLLNRALLTFSMLPEKYTSAEIREIESTHLQEIFADLLWQMSHEIETVDHTYGSSDPWEIPCVMPNYDEFANFTLGFAENLESDAIGFSDSPTKEITFSVGGKDFYVVHDSESQGEVWTLYHTYPEPFVDDETSETFMINRCTKIISCDNWKSLYAASRAIIFNRIYNETTKANI